MRFLILFLLSVAIPQATYPQLTPDLRSALQVIESLSPVTNYVSNSVTIRVEASNGHGSIAAVQLLENGVPIASDFVIPYEFRYTASGSVPRILDVRVIDKVGETSFATLRVEVSSIIDDYESGLPIFSTGTNLIFRSSTVGATRLEGEPDHAGAAGGKSVWFAWRPTVSGTASIDTFGSNFDTVLAVYVKRFSSPTLPPNTNLVAVASSEDDPANPPLSSVKFLADPMDTYYIAVDGRDGFSGDVVLSIRQTPSRAPANDSLADAASITVPTTLSAGNSAATKQNGEPQHAGNPGGASVWWNIVVDRNAPYEITTRGSDFDTLLAVYTSVSTPNNPDSTRPLMENLRLVTSSDDAPDSTNRTSTVEIKPTPNINTYWIAVDGYNGAQGLIHLAINRQPSQAPRPPNDFFVNSAVLRGSSILSNITITGASSEPGESNHLGSGPGRTNKSVWYRWVAPASGPTRLSTKGSDFDTLLGVFVGSSLANLSLIATNDNDGALVTSALVFNAMAGIEYRIGAAGYPGSVGDLVLMLNQPGTLVPRLTPIFTRGQLFLSAIAPAGNYVLESSSDLPNWSFVRVLTADEDFLVRDFDIQTPRRFYRLRKLD